MRWGLVGGSAACAWRVRWGVGLVSMVRWASTASARAYLSFSMPSPVTAEMTKSGSFLRLAKVVSFLSLSGLAESALAATRMVGLAASAGIEGFELGGDDVVVVDGVGARGAGLGVGRVGDVDEMDEDAGAFDVFEELDAEAGAEVRAFDEAGDVGDGEASLEGGFADLDDAEVGF